MRNMKSCQLGVCEVERLETRGGKKMKGTKGRAE